MDEFWNYYKKLKSYRKEPNAELAGELRKEFDAVFSPTTNYWELNKIIKATIKKKDALLTVLDFLELPLHNNECELDVREKVVQRKIRNCHRSFVGVKTSDIFLSLMAICRKNKISFWEYLNDRVRKANNVPMLYEIIQQAPLR